MNIVIEEPLIARQSLLANIDSTELKLSHRGLIPHANFRYKGLQLSLALLPQPPNQAILLLKQIACPIRLRQVQFQNIYNEQLN